MWRRPSKVLLIGGGGYVGTKLAESLVDQKMRVVSLGRSDCRVEGVNNLKGEVTDRRLMKKAMAGVKVAVYLATENKSKVYQDHYRANIEGLKIALSEARKAGVGRFIYLSTTMVFEKSKEVVDENNYQLRSGKSGNYYVDTKTEAVKIVKNTKDINWVVVYLGVVVNHDFGYRKPKTIADKIKAQLGLLTQGGVMMMGGDQDRRISWVEVDWLAKKLVDLIRTPKTEKEYIASRTNGTPISYRQAAGRMVKFFPFHIPAWLFKKLIGDDQYELMIRGNHYSSDRLEQL